MTKIAIVFRAIIFARAAVVDIAKDMTTMKFLGLRLLHKDARVCGCVICDDVVSIIRTRWEAAEYGVTEDGNAFRLVQRIMLR